MEPLKWWNIKWLYYIIISRIIIVVRIKTRYINRQVASRER
jgi:hypothetical protein